MERYNHQIKVSTFSNKYFELRKNSGKILMGCSPIEFSVVIEMPHYLCAVHVESTRHMNIQSVAIMQDT